MLMLQAMYDNVDLGDRRRYRNFFCPWPAGAGGQGSTVNASGTSHPSITEEIHTRGRSVKSVIISRKWLVLRPSSSSNVPTYTRLIIGARKVSPAVGAGVLVLVSASRRRSCKGTTLAWRQGQQKSLMINVCQLEFLRLLWLSDWSSESRITANLDDSRFS
jgi:hypothetical protein